MKRNPVFAAALSSILFFNACNTPPETTSEAETTETVTTESSTMDVDSEATSGADIVLFTAMTNRLQTQLSEMAQEKAPLPAVQTLGAEMEQANNQVLVKIQELANALQAELPGTLTVDQQAIYDSLQELPPEEFQRAYVEVLQRDIRKNMDNLKDLAAESDSEIIRGLAADIADLQQPQLETVEEVQQEMM